MKTKQFGRSMIEMLGVLAIIGVLSIGGLLGYRRAVNNHQANVILDDVNRFAFVILERSGLALGKVVPEGDFVKNTTYQLEGYQDVEPNQFSITVKNVSKGVCEALLPKAIIEYKVRVNPSANEKGKLYDTLNTDLCLDNNFMVFYFGDTAGVCNVPDDDGPTPCTTNADCCGGEFCAFEHPISKTEEGIGECYELGNSKETITEDGTRWKASTATSLMTWWSARNWCAAQGLKLANLKDIGCEGVCDKDESPVLKTMPWQGSHWLSDIHKTADIPYYISFFNAYIDVGGRQNTMMSLCR